MATYNELVDAFTLGAPLKCFYSFMEFGHCDNDIAQDNLSFEFIQTAISGTPQELVVRSWLCGDHQSAGVVSFLFDRIYLWKEEQGIIDLETTERSATSSAASNCRFAGNATPVVPAQSWSPQSGIHFSSTAANLEATSPPAAVVPSITGQNEHRKFGGSLDSLPGSSTQIHTGLSSGARSPRMRSSSQGTPKRSSISQLSSSISGSRSSSANSPELNSTRQQCHQEQSREATSLFPNESRDHISQSSPRKRLKPNSITSHRRRSEGEPGLRRRKAQSSASEPQLPLQAFNSPIEARSTHTSVGKGGPDSYRRRPAFPQHFEIQSSPTNISNRRSSPISQLPGGFIFSDSETEQETYSILSKAGTDSTNSDIGHSATQREVGDAPRSNDFNAPTVIVSSSDEELDREESESTESADEDEDSEEISNLGPASATPIRRASTFCGDHNPNSIDDRIRDLLTSRLPKKHDRSKKGFVYIFRDRQRPDLLKIGMTDMSITARRKTIERTCKIKLEVLYEDSFSDTEEEGRLRRPFTNAQRAEQLIGKELEPWKRVYECPSPSCKRRHKEWFKISEDVARPIVKRWTKFLHQRPYDDDGVLDQFWREKVNNMGRPRANEQLKDYKIRHRRWERALSTGTANWEWWVHFTGNRWLEVKILSGKVWVHRWPWWGFVLAVFNCVPLPASVAFVLLVLTAVSCLVEMTVLGK